MTRQHGMCAYGRAKGALSNSVVRARMPARWQPWVTRAFLSTIGLDAGWSISHQSDREFANDQLHCSLTITLHAQSWWLLTLFPIPIQLIEMSTHQKSRCRAEQLHVEGIVNSLHKIRGNAAWQGRLSDGQGSVDMPDPETRRTG